MSYRGFTIVLAAVLVAMCTGARATIIEFDASSSAKGSALSSWSHTVGSGADRILVVGVAAEAADASITTIKYGDANLTLAAGTLGTVGGGGTMQTTVLYYLLNPASGDANIEIAFSAGTLTNANAGGISLENVKQQGPEAGTYGSVAGPATIATDITTLTDGAWVVDIVGSGSEYSLDPNAAYGMTERYGTETSSAAGAGSTKYVATAGSTTLGWESSSVPFRMGHSLAAFEVVPEPAALALLAVGGVAILIRRRRS